MARIRKAIIYLMCALFVLTISFTLFGCGLKFNAEFYDNAADWIVEK